MDARCFVCFSLEFKSQKKQFLVQLLYKEEQIVFPDPIGTYISQGMLEEHSKKKESVKITVQSIYSYIVKKLRQITLNGKLNVRNRFFFKKSTSNQNF